MSNRRTQRPAAPAEPSEEQADLIQPLATEEPELALDAAEARAAHEETDLPAPPAPIGSPADAIRSGAAHAKETVAAFVPGVGRVVRKSVYRACYGVSYGVVFAALTVARVIPTHSAIGEGLRDGAEAARQAVEHPGEAAAVEEAEAMPA